MKVQRTKMLATDPNLESNVMIFQGIEKMLFPILYTFHYPLGGSGHVAKVRKQVSATQERPVQDSRSLRTDKGVGGGALTCSKRRECTARMFSTLTFRTQLLKQRVRKGGGTEKTSVTCHRVLKDP